MAAKKRLDLKQAREQNRIAQFAEEHPENGDREKFDRLLDAMAKTKPAGDQT